MATACSENNAASHTESMTLDSSLTILIRSFKHYLNPNKLKIIFASRQKRNSRQ